MPGDKRNFRQTERNRLIFIINSYPIVNDRRRSKSVIEKKDNAWNNICKKFNENVPEEYQVVIF